MTTGLATADALCQSEAEAANLPGTFRALLAMPGVSVLSRFDLNRGPWVRPDGMPLLPTAEDWAVMPLLDVSPNLDASGKNINYSQIALGAPDPATPGTDTTSCNGWTAPTSVACQLATWRRALSGCMMDARPRHDTPVFAVTSIEAWGKRPAFPSLHREDRRGSCAWAHRSMRAGRTQSGHAAVTCLLRWYRYQPGSKPLRG